MRPQGVVLSTMGSIPGDGMASASASGLELDNLQALGLSGKELCDHQRDLESGYVDDITPPLNGIRVDVEKTTM
jgi:hypothetical protein